VGVEERLFFDRITLHSGDVSPRSIECAFAIEADFADSWLAFGDRAAVATGVATDAIPIEFLPESGGGLADSDVEYVAQRGHWLIVRLSASSPSVRGAECQFVERIPPAAKASWKTLEVLGALRRGIAPSPHEIGVSWLRIWLWGCGCGSRLRLAGWRR
jgi:hypothetical protein